MLMFNALFLVEKRFPKQQTAVLGSPQRQFYAHLYITIDPLRGFTNQLVRLSQWKQAESPWGSRDDDDDRTVKLKDKKQ